MKKLLSKYCVLIMLLTVFSNSYSQINFEKFKSFYIIKNNNGQFKTDSFSIANQINIDINKKASYIEANESIERFIRNNKKYLLPKNTFFKGNSTDIILPIKYESNGNNHFFLSIVFNNIENDNYQYCYIINVYNSIGQSLDSIAIGKYLVAEGIKIQSYSIVNVNFGTIELNYYSKTRFEKIEKPVIKNLKLKYVFNLKTNKYNVSTQKLYTDNQNSIYDIQDINFNFFNGDATNILQYDFNKEKLKIDIGISKNKKTLYLIYSQIEAHGFLEHLSHNFLHFNNTILKSTLSGDNLIIDFADKKRVKVTLNSYNRSKKYMMFNEYQLFDTNGNLIEKKSFQNLEYITNLPKLLKMDQ